MRLAYADPPYPGCAHLYRNHPDFAGEIDHAELIARLNLDFDGWALSTSSKALQFILGLCPGDVRVTIWAKKSAPPMPKHGIYGWEPVIVRGARPPEDGLRDWIISDPEAFTFRPKPADHVIGAKPPGFCDWLFRWLGAEPSDSFSDLFPGSGAVGRAWELWIQNPSLTSSARIPWSSRWEREKARSSHPSFLDGDGVVREEIDYGR